MCQNTKPNHRRLPSLLDLLIYGDTPPEYNELIESLEARPAETAKTLEVREKGIVPKTSNSKALVAALAALDQAVIDGELPEQIAPSLYPYLVHFLSK